MVGMDAWVPDACTLPTAEQPLRVAEFDDLLTAVRDVRRPTPTALTLLLDADPALVRDLTRRESECCSFFDFTVTGGDPVRLDIAVPPARAAILDALAERATAPGSPRA